MGGGGQITLSSFFLYSSFEPASVSLPDLTHAVTLDSYHNDIPFSLIWLRALDSFLNEDCMRMDEPIIWYS